MEIQAPVVQIDGPYHSTFVITCENLGVYKSRCIFIDFHPIADQLLIISPCQQIGIFLVRDMRQDQLYLYPSLCCKDQGIDHFFIDDQIRRHDMYIIL